MASKKETPYLITIMAAVAGWSITHIADRVLNSPVIEYKVMAQAAATPQVIEVSALNLSSKAFTNLRFELQGTTVKACQRPMRFDPPAWVTNSAPEEGTDGVGFIVSQLQPGWRVTMCAVYAGGKEPVFVLKESRDQSIELRKPDLATFILKHEAVLMTVVAAFAVVGVLGWIFFATEGS